MHRIDVATGRESDTGAGKHNGMDALVAGDLQPDVFQLGMHLQRGRITHFRTVEGDCRHAVFNLDENMLVTGIAHYITLSKILSRDLEQPSPPIGVKAAAAPGISG